MGIKRNSGLGYYGQGFKGPKKNCDRCGLPYYKETELRKQRGLWLCIVGAECYDDLSDEED